MAGNLPFNLFNLLITVVPTFYVSTLVLAEQMVNTYPYLIEVFTISEQYMTADTATDRLPDAGKMLRFYDLDGIQRVDVRLSNGLPADPDHSKRIVLQRIKQLQKAEHLQMQRAATGLAKAVQYGLDRYPAIVFDGQAVIYGVTDIEEALERYRQWWGGQTP